MSSADDAAFALRRALGRFATGVTVVTTLAPDGTRCGMTVNSFNAVSIDPPLVLWSIARDAIAYPAFKDCAAFAVHILGAEQKHLSARFAARGTDKFANLQTTQGFGGAPIIAGTLACFECSNYRTVLAGDHEILLGRVEKWCAFEGEPLVLFRSTYFDSKQTSL